MRFGSGLGRLTGAVALGLLIWLAGAGGVSADPAPVLPVNAYAHQPVMAQVDLSPDGSHIAYMAPFQGRTHLIVRKLVPGPDDKPGLLGPSDSEIVGFDWASNERLLVTIMQTDKLRVGTETGVKSLPLRFSRTVSVSRDMQDMKVLLNRPPEGNRYYLQHTPILQFIDDEYVLAAFPVDDGPFPGVVKVNILTGRFTRVRRGVRDVMGYIPDPSGEIRIASTYNDETQTATYLRRTAGEAFELMQKTKVLEDDDTDSFGILGFTADGKDLYVTSRHEGDRASVYKYDLTNDVMGEKIADDPRFDVQGAVIDRGAVVAIQWTDDLPARRWLDPAVQRLQDALDKAVPDSREVIIDTAADGNLVMVASYSMQAPTTYRLFDRRTKRFDLFGDTYPGIPQEFVAKRQPISFKARDGLEIPGYLTLPVGVKGQKLPFIVLPHGGPFSRDDGSFDMMSQFLANRGYGVIQPNFRGSTGYGAAFNEAGEKQWGALMQDDVTDAAAWAVAQGYADADRMCIVGWSYGGYAALMGAVKTPDLFKCAIATAPVANMERLYDEFRIYGHKNLNRGVFFGGDRESLRPISPVHQADMIKVPVLLIHGNLDYQAAVAHSRDMNNALKEAGKSVEYIEIKDMDHYPLQTDQMVTILSAWERFLKAHIGGAGG